MPVTIHSGALAPRIWSSSTSTSSQDLFASSCPKPSKISKRIIQSSFTDSYLSDHSITSSPNGLVYSVLSAWSGHHHLILRPEDIWLSILSQLNFYINAHAEELRHLFVEHKGQKELEVIDLATLSTADFGKLAIWMTDEIHKNVLDKELQDWVLPSFSTTTYTDRIAAAILLMGTLQKYFSYRMTLICGIPTVTLLGEREDWEFLLKKIDKIPSFSTPGNTEPETFTSLLRPVLTRFVSSFADPASEETLNFWNIATHRTSGSGPFFLSG